MTNEEMDEKVLATVKAGRTRASAVQAHLQLGPEGARPLDRSLQRLRRRGFIRYDSSSGWRVKEAL